MSDAVVVTPQAPPIEQIKASMRSTWMAGDFGVIAKTIAAGAEQFVYRVTPPPGALVLDVACGTGNVTLPLARLGAITTGVDIAPNLLVQGRARAAAEGLEIQFDEGDAEALPYPDARFDYVFTMFGAMFAPRPALVAAELARVLKPGGTLAMANWNPASFSGAMFRVGSQHAPPPPGVAPPVQWGDEAIVRERLASGFIAIRTELIPIDFDLPMSPTDTVGFFRRYFGPTQMAFSRVGESGEAALTNDLVALWSGANTASDPATHTLVPNEYLQVIAMRNG
jgi:SAM-dependent methyltransferase